MSDDPRIASRRAIEALRAGVPNRDVVRALGCQQPEIEADFDNRIDGLAHGEPSAGTLVAGDFGTGKSHLLDYLREVALKKNFVCSRVVISKETPLYDKTKIFRAAVRSAMIPGRELCDPITELADALKPQAQPFQDLYRSANDPSYGLNPLFAATMLLMRDGSGDREMFTKVVRVWSGERPMMAELKRYLKVFGHRDTFDLRSVRADELAPQRLEFVSGLMRASGYSGWLIFFDEIELIGRYSALQRGRSYAALANWLDAPCKTDLGRVLVVGAITEDFETQILDDPRKEDRQRIPARLKESDQYRHIVEDARRGIKLISDERISLTKPYGAAMRATYASVRKLYAEAYECDVVNNPPRHLPNDVRMRSEIKRWITEWDLRRVDPEYRPQIEAEVMSFDLSEEPALEAEEEDA